MFNIISGGDSMADDEPLIKLLEKHITPEFVAKIAAQYRIGRSLQIGTTNLDSGRPVIWNIGRIADSGNKNAAALIRQVMLASASIPGVFPPVYIKVKGPDGKFYDEMHVDGGTTAQIFLYPSFNNWAEVVKKLEVTGRPKAYLIRNSRTDEDYDPVTPKIRPILFKSVSTLIMSQGVGDLYRIHSLAQRDGIDLQITWIPTESVDVKSEQVFDPKYMSALFDFGRQRVKQQEFWVDPIKLLLNHRQESPAQ
jgi:predicted acylesterase/phospholipase RssA